MSTAQFTLESLISDKSGARRPKRVLFATPEQRTQAAQVRIFATSKFDPERAARAAARIAQLGAGMTPSRAFGAAALIRKIRDGK